MPKSYREEFKIIRDILAATVETTTTSRISARANIEYGKTKNLLELLQTSGLVERIYDKQREPKPTYVWVANHDGAWFGHLLGRVIENLEH